MQLAIRDAKTEGFQSVTPRRQPRWRWTHSLLLATTAAIVCAAIVQTRQNSSANVAQAFVTRPIVIGDIESKVTATGTVEPRTVIDVSVEQSGLVRRVLVTWNDRVHVGQLLAELDTDKLEFQATRGRAAVNVARARLAEVEATAVEKQRDYERKQTLAERGISSTKDLEAAKAARDRAAASVATANAELVQVEADFKGIENNLAKARIVSPIDGVVLKRNVEPGQTIAATLSAPVLFTLAEDLTKLKVKIDVDEADVAALRVGQRASFRVEALRDRTFAAVIEEIRLQAETVQGVVTYKTVLGVDNADLVLRPGMTATAEVSTNRVANVLLLPISTLRFVPPKEAEPIRRVGGLIPTPPGKITKKAPSDEHAVLVRSGAVRPIWLVVGDRLEARTVRLGLSDGRNTEVIGDDIKPGDQVATELRGNR